MKIYCTYHPSSVLAGGYQFESRIVQDFRKFKQRTLKVPSKRLPLLRTCVGFDTEYDPSNKLLTVGLADREHAQALETTEKDYLKKTRKVIKKAKVLVGHSVAGDLDYLVRLNLAKETWLRGINVKDSFLLARMVDENRGKGAYGLEPLLLSEFNFGSWKSETEKLLKSTGNAADWSPEQRVERCRLDAWATRILAEHFERKLLRIK